MSLTYVSPKRPNRVYVRKFDHDEAKRRHASGESAAALAREYGVSAPAVWMVVTEKGAHWRDTTRFKGASRCERCGAKTNAATKPRTGVVRLCHSCASDAQATSARDGELHCYACGEWKPDDAFPYERAATIRRRGRNSACRACQTRLKREYRARNREKSRAYDRAYSAARRANALDNGAERSPSVERTQSELTQASADRRSGEAEQATRERGY